MHANERHIIDGVSCLNSFTYCRRSVTDRYCCELQDDVFVLPSRRHCSDDSVKQWETLFAATWSGFSSLIKPQWIYYYCFENTAPSFYFGENRSEFRLAQRKQRTENGKSNFIKSSKCKFHFFIGIPCAASTRQWGECFRIDGVCLQWITGASRAESIVKRHWSASFLHSAFYLSELSPSESMGWDGIIDLMIEAALAFK